MISITFTGLPPEWALHASTWLSWIQKEASWPGKLEEAYPAYCEFISKLSFLEQVNINIADREMEQSAINRLKKYELNWHNVKFHYFPTNDAWCRDHGPAFLLHKTQKGKRAIIDWGYNAWGEKYPPYDLDDVIPTRVGELLGLEVFNPGIVMEGGSVEFNGAGTILTTKACLLNPNRNPNLNQEQIEWYLKEFYGAEQILWLGDGIVGDDTDGHIDDIARFVKPDTILTVVEEDPDDENYEVHVPTFRDSKNDPIALRTIQRCFPDRKIFGIDSTDLIWGLGSFHCLSQQEPI